MNGETLGVEQHVAASTAMAGYVSGTSKLAIEPTYIHERRRTFNLQTILLMSAVFLLHYVENCTLQGNRTVTPVASMAKHSPNQNVK